MNEWLTLLNGFWGTIQGGQVQAAQFWIYPILMVLVAVEGPVSILLAAAASSAGFMNPLPVFIAASLGNLIADTLWYGLGYYGKIDWLLQRKKLFGVDPEKIDLLKHSIDRNVIKILLVAKITNGLIVPALVATGVARVPLRRWFLTIFLSNALITGIFVAAGYFAAVNLMKVADGIRYAAFGFSVILFFAILVYVRRLFSQNVMASIEEKDRPAA